MEEQSNVHVPRVKLGSQGLEVSRLGSGCLGLTGHYNSPISEEQGKSIINEAFHKGITFFDTAYVYGSHANEILIGKALKQLPREKIQLATKFGIENFDGSSVVINERPESVRAYCEASLKRLDVAYIDIYYQHRVDKSVPIEDTVGEMKKLVEEGKVKYIGLSEASADTISRAHAVHPISVVQMEWSLWTRDVEQEIVPLCRELGIGIGTCSPLGGEIFAGTTVENLPPKNILFSGDYLKKKILYACLTKLSAKHHCTPSQLALAWLLHQGSDVVPILGTENLVNCILSLKVKLTEEDLKEISDALPAEGFASDRLTGQFASDICQDANTPTKFTKYELEHFADEDVSQDSVELPRMCLAKRVVKTTPRDIENAILKLKENEKGLSDDAGGVADDSDDNDDNDDDDDSSWMNKVRIKVNKRRHTAHANRPCTIFKVQENIRRCNPDAYTPLVISIGPYHHQRWVQDSNFEGMENHKWLCLRRLLFRHRSRRRATELLDKCLLVMKSLDSKVRRCYSEFLDRHLNAHRLALVMLLDGCFLLHHLLKRENLIDHVGNKDGDNDDDQVEDGEIMLELGDGDEEMEEEPLLRTLWIWNFVLDDLLKLENQIPFFVLTTLFDLLKVPGDEGVDLVNLAFKLFSGIHPSKSQTFPILPTANQVHHLLHLFHSSLVPSENHHVLDITQAVKAPEWIPNATELQQAGVKFVQKKNASSFLDISFSSNGTMEIPELCLYDHTDTLFRNLIAFEQCYPDTRTYITIYAAFMDCIIDSPKDVRLLHLKGILTNGLSTDEAAADVFNKLCYQIHYASDRNYLYGLFVAVNKYYESSWNQWRAKLMRDYFSNPWAIISLIAAVLLLLLTVEQSFFSAYSYFRPS